MSEDEIPEAGTAGSGTAETRTAEAGAASETPGAAGPGDDAAAQAGASAPAEADGTAPDGADEAAPDAANEGEGPEPDGVCRLHARGRLEETEALLAWLREADPEAPLLLDAGEVESVSTPYVLAIAAAARARAEAGRPAVLRGPSPAFVDAFSDLGLFGDLMKMEIRP